MTGRGLPWTRVKLFIAGALYRALRPFLGREPRVIRRGGVAYRADLTEAVDFALFVAGGFQSYVFKSPLLRLPEDAVVLDVGANMGSMALSFARRLPRSTVLAFEPTHGAFRKLADNIALNPDLAPRVTAVQAFLSDASAARHGLTAFSSWKIDGARPGRHPLHGGTLEPADGVPAFTLDDVVRDRGLRRVDLVKVDTEGHELSVLRGARETLARLKPKVIFELGLYTLEERGLRLEDYFDLLEPLGYRWVDLKSGRALDRRNAAALVPARSTTDVLALPGGGA